MYSNYVFLLAACSPGWTATRNRDFHSSILTFHYTLLHEITRSIQDHVCTLWWMPK